MTARRRLLTSFCVIAYVAAHFALPAASRAATTAPPQTSDLRHAAYLSWQPNVTAGFSPQVAASSSGHMVAAWSQRSGSTSGVYVSRLNARGRWTPPALVRGSAPSSGSSPSGVRVGVDDRGRVLVAWLDPRVRYAWVLPGVRTQPPARTLAAGTGTVRDLALDLAGSGRGALAWWQSQSSGAASVYASRVDAGAAATTPRLVAGEGAEYAAEVDVAIARDGSAIVVHGWAATFPGGRDVQVRQALLAESGAVSDQRQVGEALDLNGGPPRVDASGSGAVVATWARLCGGSELPCRDGIVVAQTGTTAAGLTSGERRLTNPGNGDPAIPVTEAQEPVAAIGEDGEMVVAWIVDTIDTQAIDTVHLTTAAVGTATRLSARSSAPRALDVQVTAGRVVWAWVDDFDGDPATATPRAYASMGTVSLASGMVAPAEPAQMRGGNADTPSVAIAGTGSIAVSWLDRAKRVMAATNIVDRTPARAIARRSGLTFRLDSQRRVPIPVTCPTGELYCVTGVQLLLAPEKPGAPARVVGSGSGRIVGGGTRYLPVTPSASALARIQRSGRLLVYARITTRDLRGNRVTIARRWFVARRGIVLEA